jgi:tetratricopeptide (TPR) repeat protein
MLFEVARAIAELGDGAGAPLLLELERSAPENLAHLAFLHAQLGRTRDVERIAEALGDPALLPASRRGWLVDALERIGDTARADAVAESSPGSEQRELLLARGLQALERGAAARGRAFVHAWVEGVPADAASSTARSAARVLSMAGDRDGARAWLARAEQGARTDDDRVAIATAYVDAGAIAPAMRIADAIERGHGGRRRKIFEASAWMPALAVVHERAGDHARALALVERYAKASAETLGLAFEATNALAFARIGARDRAEAWFERMSWPYAREYDTEAMDRRHAAFTDVRLDLGEPALAIDHAARIVAPSLRTGALLAIARWARAHEAVPIDITPLG